MEPIPFYKMSGSGNDFIIIDNRRGIVAAQSMPTFAARVCRRKMSAGADGLILIEDSERVDFKWQFFNADGSRAEMCGNGARCAARFALVQGIAGAQMAFETDAGIVAAEVGGERVKIKMTDPSELRLDETMDLQGGSWTISSVNTGVPHAVAEVADIEALDVAAVGREIRRHPRFAPAGTNANFVCPLKDGGIAVRTYERGVEGETLACGTGSVAAALVRSAKYGAASPVRVLTRSGGHLNIYFEDDGGRYHDVYLEGDARIIYEGALCADAWNYGGE